MEREVFAMMYLLPSDDWLRSKVMRIFVPDNALREIDMNVGGLKRTFSIKPIRGDGNCLFRAVSQALTDTERAHSVFRYSAVKFATEDDVLSHFITPDWIRDMSRRGEWGDAMAIQALCDVFQVCVRVLRVVDVDVDDAKVLEMVWGPTKTKTKCVFVGDFTNVVTLLLTGPGLGTHFELLYPKK